MERIDGFELQLNLTAAFINTKGYSISGTAKIGNDPFTVRGRGFVQSNVILLPQSQPAYPGAYDYQPALELMDANNNVIWSVGGRPVLGWAVILEGLNGGH